jgi:hypothetical protein
MMSRVSDNFFTSVKPAFLYDDQMPFHAKASGILPDLLTTGYASTIFAPWLKA